MSYIGNPPLTGSYKKLDDISSGFNGSTTTFNLTSSSDAVTPGSPNALIISLGGVVQEPTSSYTVSGSTIAFTTAPAASTTFWGVMLGDTLYVGVSQGTVTPSMLSTGGPYWDTSGNVGVGTTSPAAKLDVRGSSTFLVNTTNPTAWVSVDSALTTGSLYNQFNTTSNIGISGTYTNHAYAFVTNNNERARIDSSGNVGIGTSNTPSNKDTVTPKFVVNGSGVAGSMQIVRNTTVGAGGAVLELTATRGSDVNSYTILQNGDGVGSVVFGGADGNEFVVAGSIQCQVDGTPGDNDMPGRLIFNTTADGASATTERMRINSSGNVGIGTSSPPSGSRLSVVGGGIQLSGGTSAQAGLRIQTSSGVATISGINNDNNAYNPISFYTGASEAMRITANGGVAFGGASNYGTSGQVLTSNGDAAPTWGTVSGTPAGSVVAFAGSSAPSGWLLCSGAAVSRSTYAALFAVIGTTYGAGDGSTTFNLPDLRGRAVAGVDNMGGTAANRITSGGSGITGTTLGAAGGAQTFTLSTNEMPSHNHTYYAYPSGGSSAYPYWVTNTQNSPQGFSTTNAGGGGASNVTQPTMMLNYIIKT